jgi:NAD(P)-dependent dehydrogenase (short-subunit alcohol dehydrogenase family)
VRHLQVDSAASWLRVAATARDVTALDELVTEFGARVLPLALDVTDRAEAFATVEQAHQRFGRLDVVVNNAGYGHFGAVEELSESDLRGQLETNLFGAVWVTQAALPILREQRAGPGQISSIGGVGAFANLGAYHASKWALEAISESLAAEVDRWGIKVTLVEPAGFDTDWARPSSRRSAPMPEYDFFREAAAARRGAQEPGDPRAAADALLDIVDAPEPPLRVLLGARAFDLVSALYQRRLATWGEHRELAMRAHGAVR